MFLKGTPVDEFAESTLRRWFGCIAAVGAAMLVYASIVPVTPRTDSWDDAVAAFR